MSKAKAIVPRKVRNAMVAPWLKIQKKFGATDAWIVYMLAQGNAPDKVHKILQDSRGILQGSDGKPIVIGSDITLEHIVELSRREYRTILRVAKECVYEMEIARATGVKALGLERLMQALGRLESADVEHIGKVTRAIEVADSVIDKAISRDMALRKQAGAEMQEAFSRENGSEGCLSAQLMKGLEARIGEEGAEEDGHEKDTGHE